ncbi:hypothetical protein [Noviherbaspirillum pedocola]|uniref:Uncharacterized protein n=1 Tax=Noviherbaspirillum pedocola TaxID=2801341 RepID=A0A934SU58_9BURK|nr:hypothetical protein [Noviherbaspirillum pedocola]MBK4735288.1 hypothetical protein [Noviherbaspirillum pedocola]
MDLPLRLAYHAYLRLLTWPARRRRAARARRSALERRSHPPTACNAPNQAQGLNTADAADAADALATRLGEAYRGAGVLIGFASATGVLLSILPSAIGFHGRDAMAVMLFRACAMLSGPLLAWQVKRRGMHRHWLAARQAAEAARCAELRRRIDNARREAHAALRPLAAELSRLLEGPAGQIEYNHRKSEDYAAIGALTNRISFGIFAVTVALAWFQPFYNPAAMLLVTAFLPALAGTLHFVNAFLEIGRLQQAHLETAVRLRRILGTVRANVDEDDPGILIDAAVETCAVLDDSNATWRQVAYAQLAKPV